MAPSTPVTRRPSKSSKPLQVSNGTPAIARTSGNARDTTYRPPTAINKTPVAPRTPRNPRIPRSQAFNNFLDNLDWEPFKARVRYEEFDAIADADVRGYVRRHHEECLLWFCSMDRIMPCRVQQKKTFVDFMKDNSNRRFCTPPRTTPRVNKDVSSDIHCDDCGAKHRRDNNLRWLDEARANAELSESVMMSSGDNDY